MPTYHFKLELEGDIMSSETLNITLTVQAAPPGPLAVVDANGQPLADGADIALQPETVGVADPGQVICTVSGGVPPYGLTLSSGSLPAGDDITSTTNADGSETFTLEGTPTAAGDAAFAITVADSAPAPSKVTLKAKTALRK